MIGRGAPIREPANAAALDAMCRVQPAEGRRTAENAAEFRLAGRLEQGPDQLNGRVRPRQAVAHSDILCECALANEAWHDTHVANSLITTDRAARLAAAEAAATKVLSLAPDHAFAHLALGAVYMFSNRPAQGIAECEHALALNQSLAAAHATIGLGKIALGRAEETEGHILEALRLSPRDVLAYHWMFMAGVAKLQLGPSEAIPNAASCKV